MKKIFTLLTMALLAIGAQAQETLILDQSATYTDNQVLTTTNAQVTLGNDLKNAQWSFENAEASGEYVNDFIVACKDKNGKDINGCVTIHGENNPKDGTTSGAGSGIDCSSSKTSASLPQNGTYYVFKATSAGTLKFGVVLNANKEFYIIDATTITESDGKKRVELPASNITDYILKDEAGNNVTLNDGSKGGKTISNKVVGFIEFTPVANHVYYLFCTGSKLGFFGYIFTPSGGEEPQAVDVAFSLSESEIFVDETAQIKVNNKSGLDGLTMNKLEYEKSVISIDETGKITPVAAGTSTITFSTDAVDGKYNAGSANLSITVAERPIPDEIDYPTSTDGVIVSGTTAVATVKIHENTDEVKCIQLKSGYTSDGVVNGNYIKLVKKDGFKAGDVVTIAGVINNNDASKRATAELFAIDEDNKAIKINTFKDFINSYSATGDPEDQEYVLEGKYDVLYLGRNGGTTASLTKIKVVSAPPAEPHEREAINLAGELSEADAAALEASEDWTKNEDGSYGYKAVESEVAKAGFAIEGVSLFSGLKFGRNGSIDANKITLIPGKGISLAGSQYRIILTGLAKDDEVSLRITGNGDGDRSVTLSNATKKEAAAPARRAEEAAAKLTSSDKETVEGTFVVSSDGSVIIETDGGLTVNAISINAELPEYTPTGISTIKAETTTDAPVYNLSGQRVDENYRGVVIKNGRKVVNK